MGRRSPINGRHTMSDETNTNATPAPGAGDTKGATQDQAPKSD